MLFFLCLIGTVNAEKQLSYQKYGTPTFSFNDEPLIITFNASYSLDGQKYDKHFSNLSDENIFLGYTITGKKYLGSDVISGNGSCIPPIFGEENPGAPYPICLDVQTTTNEGVRPAKVMILYSTTIPEIDEYVNNPTYEGEILVHYQIKNPRISTVSPIVLNLGDWPVRVNDEKITEILDKPISNDTILIFGSNTSLILNKGNSNIVALRTKAGTLNYTDNELTAFPRSNPDFSYIFFKNKGNYFLKIQRISQVQDGVLSLNFRPIKIDFSLKIEDPIVENTLSFTENTQDTLRYKPKLQINISDNKISQLVFNYLSGGKEINKSVLLNPNGTYFFNDYVDAKGNFFYYPFDHFYSKISVSPPLLISDEKEISTESNSGFDASIDIHYKTINIEFSRSIETWLILIVSLLISIIAVIGYFNKIKPDNPLLELLGVISPIFLLILVSGLNHLLSIGTIMIVVPFLIIGFYFIYWKKRKIQIKRKNKKGKEKIKK